MGPGRAWACGRQRARDREGGRAHILPDARERDGGAGARDAVYASAPGGGRGRRSRAAVRARSGISGESALVLHVVLAGDLGTLTYFLPVLARGADDEAPAPAGLVPGVPLVDVR